MTTCKTNWVNKTPQKLAASVSAEKLAVHASRFKFIGLIKVIKKMQPVGTADITAALKDITFDGVRKRLVDATAAGLISHTRERPFLYSIAK